jgi:hypothetical protein
MVAYRATTVSLPVVQVNPGREDSEDRQCGRELVVSSVQRLDKLCDEDDNRNCLADFQQPYIPYIISLNPSLGVSVVILITYPRRLTTAARRGKTSYEDPQLTR